MTDAVSAAETGGAANGVGAMSFARGSNNSGVRLYNERLVLSLIRRSTGLAKAEIARRTGLTAPAVMKIIRQLEADGLVRREAPRRGRVGQPSVPFTLNPDGAFSLGLKIGRRSAELVLLDLAGNARTVIERTYAYPEVEAVGRFVRYGIDEVTRGLDAGQRARICGLGVGMPFELWNWRDEIAAPDGVLEAWRDVDVAAEIGAHFDGPVHVSNDATAACAAELAFGANRDYLDYFYLFIAWFAGGGVVLNGALFPGRTGNAGAAGSMPVAGGRGRPQQLIRAASLYPLERRFVEAGRDPTAFWDDGHDWRTLGPQLDGWLATAAAALAQAAAAAAAVIDFQAVIIDGAMPPDIRARLVAETSAAYADLDRQGLSPLEIAEGSIGRRARAIGAASLPLIANFELDQNLLFKHQPANA